MQIATLSYHYKPKENLNGDSRAKLCHRHIRTTVTKVEKKSKQRQSLHSDLTRHTNGQLPPLNTSVRRRSSMRINGSSLPSSKLGEPLHHYPPRRSLSQLSNTSEHLDARSRSISPAGISRPASKLVRTKFGYPIKLRSADFYGPDKSDTELHLLEDSFVNDSIRSAHQYGRASIIPAYDPLDDPHLRRFFQSPIVLDVVRKTLIVDPHHSYKPEERASKLTKLVKRSKSNGAYDRHDNDYHRIVTKGSSGYAKLNGYDCLPSHSPARHFHGRLSETEPALSSSQRWNTAESRYNHSNTHEKIRRSTSTSITTIPHNEIHEQSTKKKTHRHEKSKHLKPLATSSPSRHSIDHPSDQKTDYTIPSTVPQV